MTRDSDDKLAGPGGMREMDFLVESVPNLVHPSAPARGQNPWFGLLWPLLISGAGGMLCLWAAGFTLGLFLGGLLVVAIVAGPLVAGEDTWLGRGLAWGGAVHGMAAVWLYAVLLAEADLGLWASCYLVLAAFAAAVTGVVALLRRIGVGRVVSGGLVTLAALAWLTWPVWLSAALGGARGERLTGWLVPANPMFAVNGVLREGMGVWAEQPIAYNVSTMSEVAYGMPEGVGWALVVHGAIAIAGIGGAVVGRRET